MKLKRQLSATDVEPPSVDGIQQSLTQVSKKGRRGGKGKTKTKPTLSQPPADSNSNSNSDVEEDEMVTVTSCIVCSEDAALSSSIKCDSCDLYYHLKCCAVDESDHPAIIKLISFIGWVCKICRDESICELN